MAALIFLFSFCIASIPIFITVWMDRPYFGAAFEIDSYKIASRELLFLGSAISGLAMLEEIGALLGRTSKANPYLILVMIFVFLITIIFSMFRYGQLARASADELKKQATPQIWFAWALALTSGVAAGWLKAQG